MGDDDSTDIMTWQEEALDRLRKARHPSGVWGYSPHLRPGTEPTALACIAWLEAGAEKSEIQNGLTWLARRQHGSGGVSIADGVSGPCWPTGLAVLAWNQANHQGMTDFIPNCRRGVQWLLESEGLPFQSNPAIYGHNTQLKAWGWVDGTHSWIEPSVYAVLALRAVGQTANPRVREALEVFLDRSISGGGWNYGNSRMFGAELRPFPAQTGMVLAAMAGEPRTRHIDTAIDFLHGELPRLRTPVSLGWGLIGLTAWEARPKDADQWLDLCFRRLCAKPAQPHCEALLLLARSNPGWLISAGKEISLES